MNICVYGAASEEIDRRYIEAAEELGAEMARHGHALIFGGGAWGLMGGAARGAERENGAIIGIAPHFFDTNNILFPRCTEMIFTETMRERKQLMENQADGFIMTPGGIGTYEEFFEILTLKQLGRHNKPIVILNTLHYYDRICSLLQGTAEDGFMKKACLSLYTVCDTPQEAVRSIEQYDPNAVDVRHLKNL